MDGFMETFKADFTNIKKEMQYTKNYFLVAFILVAWFLLLIGKGPEYHIGFGLWINILLILMIHYKSNMYALLLLFILLCAYVVMYLLDLNEVFERDNTTNRVMYTLMVISSLPYLWVALNINNSLFQVNYRSYFVFVFLLEYVLFLVFSFM